MGMFDYIVCEYPVPGHDSVKEWQTKDTPMQYLDSYKIDAEGQLWHEQYDVEDRSDPTKPGLAGLAGCMTRVNQRWVQIDFRGHIEFYGGEYCYSALFDKGKLISIEPVTE